MRQTALHDVPVFTLVQLSDTHPEKYMFKYMYFNCHPDLNQLNELHMLCQRTDEFSPISPKDLYHLLT